MVLAVPSVKTTVFCKKTPCNNLHDVFFHKTVMQGTKNCADEYSYLLRCDCRPAHSYVSEKVLSP